MPNPKSCQSNQALRNPLTSLSYRTPLNLATNFARGNFQRRNAAKSFYKKGNGNTTRTTRGSTKGGQVTKVILMERKDLYSTLFAEESEEKKPAKKSQRRGMNV